MAKICPVCGKETPLRKETKDKYCTFCSKECRRSIEGKAYLKQKQAESIKDIDWQKIYEKRKQTCREKYGVDNPAQAKQSREKISASKKLMNHSLSNEKRKRTCLKKYGVEFNTQADSVIQKKLETWKENYNVSHPMKSDIIKNKVTESRLRSYYENVISKSDLFIPLFSIDEWIERHGATTKEDEPGKFFSFQCKKCNHQFEQNLWNGFSICQCPVCFPPDISKPQIELKEFIQQLLPNDEIFINSKKTPIYPLELDLYIPSKNFAIEYNGLAFHSFGTSKHSILNNADMETTHKYHILKKLEACEKNNIKLLNIFENEWLDPIKQLIWKSIIINQFGISTAPVMARECVIKKVPNDIARWFLDNNHLQGYRPASVQLGLYLNDDKLVQMMSFSKPRFSNVAEWEIIRFATDSISCNELRVVGGASKLFTAFRREYNPKSIITYADRRFSKGNVYQMLGFTEMKYSNPNYFYLKENTKKLFSREKFQKHKLASQLEIFDSNLSERENMYSNGWRRIYDCGNKVFVWSEIL